MHTSTIVSITYRCYCMHILKARVILLLIAAMQLFIRSNLKS